MYKSAYSRNGRLLEPQKGIAIPSVIDCRLRRNNFHEGQLSIRSQANTIAVATDKRDCVFILRGCVRDLKVLIIF